MVDAEEARGVFMTVAMIGVLGLGEVTLTPSRCIDIPASIGDSASLRGIESSVLVSEPRRCTGADPAVLDKEISADCPRVLRSIAAIVLGPTSASRSWRSQQSSRLT